MNSSLSVPTDNIYKFYALFGLVLIVTSLFLFVLTYNFHYERATEMYLEIAKIESQEKISNYEKTKKEALEKRLEIDSSNKSFYISVILVFLFTGTALTIYGFRRWHKNIQPVLDEISLLELEKLKQETKKQGTYRFYVNSRRKSV